MKKTAFAAVLLAAVLLAGLSACGEKETQDETPAGTPVEAQTVERGPMSTENQVTGKVVAGNEVNVFPLLQAEYTSVSVEVGDTVQAGQTVATLDVSAYSQNLAQLRASYNTAANSYASTKSMYDSQIALYQKTLSDTKALYEIGAASELSVQQAELQLTTAQSAETNALNQYQSTMDTLASNMATVQDNVSKGTLSAPISGTVTAVNAKSGAFGSPSMAAATISENANLQVQVDVSEALAPKLSLGQSVNVTIDAVGTDAISGTISKIDPAASAVNSLYTVTIDIPASCGATAGMSASVVFYTDSKSDTVIVPTEAILTSGNEKYVMTVDSDNKAHKVVVETGLNGSGTTEITSGLSGGEILVTSGQSYLSEGTLVRVVG